MLSVKTTSAGIFSGLAEWMTSFVDSPAAGLSLFLFAFAESSFFPIPPDALLIGLCLTDRALSSLPVTMWLAALCTAGSALGGGFGYVLGSKAGRPILVRLASAETIENVESLLQKYDVWAIAIAGFTPIPYKVFTIASGMLRVKFGRFMLASVASRGARFFLVAAVCHAIGRPVRDLFDRYLDSEKYIAIGALLIVAGVVGGFFLVKWWMARYKRDPGSNDTPPDGGTP